MRPPSDPADSITPLLWNDQDTGEEKSEAVVYGRVADFCLRLLTKKPSTWKQYRAFGEEVPITALVSQIPADVDVGRTQAKDREEPPREPVVSAEMQRIQALVGKMDTIANAVQALADTNPRRGAATVGESHEIPEPTAAQLQELRALREEVAAGVGEPKRRGKGTTRPGPAASRESGSGAETLGNKEETGTAALTAALRDVIVETGRNLL